MSELPNGWARARLDELVDLNPKQNFDDELTAGFVPMSHAPTNFRDKLRFDVRNWGEIKKTYTNFKDGDVIFAKVTPCFENGKAALVNGMPNGIGAGSSEFFVLRPSSTEVSAKYMLALIKSRDFMREGAANMTGAVGLRRVPRQFVENYSVPMPPAAEQARIAQKLDELLAQVDTVKARIDAIPALLKRFRQAILTAAVSGRLTEEWRKPMKLKKLDIEKIKAEQFLIGITKGNFPTNKTKTPLYHGFYDSIKHTKDWPAVRIGDICGCIVPNRDKPKSFSGKIHWLLTENISEQSIFIDYKRVAAGLTASEAEEFKAKIIPKNSVLMTCVGRLGLSAIVKEECVINQQLHAFLESEHLNQKFLAFAIRANKGYFDKASTSTTISYLNKTACNSLPIGLPTQQEQAEIVRRVEQLFAFTDNLEAKVASAKNRIDHLTQSILAKAFRGELVPQDPNDEPASVLLERIKAQRAAAPKAKRSRKTSA